MTAMGPASLAPGFGVGGGIGVSAAGAEATNGILTKASAYIDTSDIASAGNVLVTAADTDSISATVATASLAVGAAGGVGVGASIGASLAQNLIGWTRRSEEHTFELQSLTNLVCRLLLEKKKTKKEAIYNHLHDAE